MKDPLVPTTDRPDAAQTVIDTDPDTFLSWLERYLQGLGAKPVPWSLHPPDALGPPPPPRPPSSCATPTYYEVERHRGGYSVVVGRIAPMMLEPGEERPLECEELMVYVQRVKAERTEVTVRCTDPGLLPYFDELLRDIGMRYPESGLAQGGQELSKPAAEARAEGEKDKDKLPSGKRLLLPNYRKDLPEEYWKFVDENGRRPTHEELAAKLLVDVATIKRRVGNIRQLGDPWPPPRPSQPH